VRRPVHMSWTPAPSNALCGLSFKAAPIVSARPKDVTCAACLNRLARAGIRLDPRAAAGPSPRDSKGRDANGVARGAGVDGAAFGAHVAVRTNRVRSGRAPQPGDPLFVCPAPENEHAPVRGNDALEDEHPATPLRRSAPRSSQASSLAMGLVGALALLAGCTPAPRPVVPDVAGELHELVARVDQLDARRMLAADAAGACRQACLTEPASLTFRGDRVECRCRKAPSLGVHRIPKPSSPAMAHEPEELVSGLSQDLRGELGAARGEDRADAELVLSNAAPMR
jgi:hypothetical protein